MSEQPYNDEIDLAILFRRLWAARLVVFLSVLVVAMLSGTYALVVELRNGAKTTVTLDLRFNFPGIQNGIYPNEQPFSLNDLVAPAILNQVFDQQSLEEYGMSRSEFISAVQIAPYATNREFIESKFKFGLANKSLSAAEIDELNTNYTKALNAANRRFARLSFSMLVKKALPSHIMAATLTAIPTVWARESIESYGVLNVTLATVGELDTDLLHDYEYIVSAQYLSDYLTYVIKSANSLQEDKAARLLVDPKASLTIDGIIEQLTTLKKFHVDVLQRSFSVVPVVKNLDESVFYLNNQITVMQDRLYQLQRQAVVMDEAYTRLLDSSSRVLSTGDQSASVAQYGDDILTRLISIGDELTESKFKQSLLNRSIELKLDAEKTLTDINILKKNLDVLESSLVDDGGIKKRVSSEIDFITNRLKYLSGSVNRIAALRSERVLGRSGALYDINSEPVIISNKYGMFARLTQYSLLGAIAGLFLGLFVALFVTVIKKYGGVIESNDS